MNDRPGYGERLLRASRARKELERAVRVFAGDELGLVLESNPFFKYAYTDGPIALETGECFVLATQMRYFANGRRIPTSIRLEPSMLTEDQAGILPEHGSSVIDQLRSRLDIAAQRVIRESETASSA